MINHQRPVHEECLAVDWKTLDLTLLQSVQPFRIAHLHRNQLGLEEREKLVPLQLHLVRQFQNGNPFAFVSDSTVQFHVQSQPQIRFEHDGSDTAYLE